MRTQGGLYFNSFGAHHIDRDSIFEKFVDEFNDYDEIVEVLSTNKNVQDAIEPLNVVEKTGINSLSKVVRNQFASGRPDPRFIIVFMARQFRSC